MKTKKHSLLNTFATIFGGCGRKGIDEKNRILYEKVFPLLSLSTYLNNFQPKDNFDSTEGGYFSLNKYPMHFVVLASKHQIQMNKSIKRKSIFV